MTNEDGQAETSNDVKQVYKVSVKPPPFWNEKPALWFSVVEAQFLTANITIELTKYYHAIQAMDQATLSKVEDLILKPPAVDPYTTLKNSIISRLSDSDNKKIQKLIRDLDLGDKKPSQLLREMRAMAGENFPDATIKNLWLQRLPPQAQAILTVSTEPIDKLATMADAILETFALSSSVFTVSSNPPSTSNAFETFSSHIREELAALRKQVNEIQRSRSSSNQRSRSKSPSRTDKPLCWFHYKFKENARKCKPPCAFTAKQGNL